MPIASSHVIGLIEIDSPAALAALYEGELRVERPLRFGAPGAALSARDARYGTLTGLNGTITETVEANLPALSVELGAAVASFCLRLGQARASAGDTR